MHVEHVQSLTIYMQYEPVFKIKCLVERNECKTFSEIHD